MNDYKYIIMCGGNYDYWQTPKQMLEINGEPIVARTIRLLKDAGIEDIAISSNNPVFEQFGVPVLHHKNDMRVRSQSDVSGYWVDCFYPMDAPACYLMGDVVFSPNAIKTIVEYDTDDIMLFGSRKPFADEYPKWWREPFAFKVANQKRFREAINETKALADMGAFKVHPIAWQLWGVIMSGNYRLHSYETINDYTCDIDTPKDIPLFEKVLSRV